MPCSSRRSRSCASSSPELQPGAHRGAPGASSLRPRREWRFAGYVPELTWSELYATAALLVFPSRYEGFGLPVVEAMAAGCPVAAARAGSLPEVAGDAGVLFDPEDAEDIASGIHQALDTYGRAAARRGLRRAAGFTWSQCAETHVAVYEALGA